MDTVPPLRDTPTPDLVGILAPAPAPVLELVDLDVGLTALADREDVATVGERASLRRVRAMLEAQASGLLEE